MAFLDNSGDIILDAVLTDMGRKRLAAGRFTVSKFALGDEEINYELWDPSDARGTAFYDLQIMQTPILEAFTSDQSLMKSRLLSFARNDLLYLPILKLNNKSINTISRPFGTLSGDSISSPVFYLTADRKTANLNLDAPGGNLEHGIINGIPQNTHTGQTKLIAIDQGIQNPDSSSSMSIVSPFDPSELKETAFIVKCDNRLLSINTVGGGAEPDANGGDVQSREPQYIDDDYVASYYFTYLQSNGAIKDGIGSEYRLRRSVGINDSNEANVDAAKQREVFSGPLGRTLQIVPTVRPELRLADGVFRELGSVENGPYDSTGLTLRTSEATATKLTSYRQIDTVITVQGLTTGYSIDIPIKIIKGIFS